MLTRTVRRTSISFARAALVAVVVLATAAAPVAAGFSPPPPEDGSSGRVGDHGLVGAETQGTCVYGYYDDSNTYYNWLYRMKVQAPLATTHPDRERQRIAWRVVVIGWDYTNDRFVRVAMSPWESATTTSGEAADFHVRKVDFEALAYDNVLNVYRAKIQLRWYGKNGTTVVGKAWLYPDAYHTVEQGQDLGSQPDHCGSTTG